MSFVTFEMLLVTKQSIFMTLGAQSAPPPGKIGLSKKITKSVMKMDSFPKMIFFLLKIQIKTISGVFCRISQDTIIYHFGRK